MMHYNITSVRKTGSAHRVCQDRFRTVCDQDRLILIAADGHGGRPYTRSGLGARFACAAAEAALRAGIDDGSIPAAIKDRYDAMVAKHLALRPLEAWELERLGGRARREVYGATLLAAMITPDSTLLVQLGDGEIHALKEDGTFFPRLPDDSACRGNLTTSLCNSRAFALDSFRVIRYPEPAAALMMFTDGCEGGLLQAASGVADLPCLQAHLDAMLRTTNHGDDQTFLLAVDAGAVEQAAFRDTLTAALEDMKAAAKRARQEARDREDYMQLCSYMSLALRRANRMKQKNDPELEVFLQKLKPSYERYLQLQARFGTNRGG